MAFSYTVITLIQKYGTTEKVLALIEQTKKVLSVPQLISTHKRVSKMWHGVLSQNEGTKDGAEIKADLLVLEAYGKKLNNLSRQQ